MAGAKTKLGTVVLHEVWGLFTHMECAMDKSWFNSYRGTTLSVIALDLAMAAHDYQPAHCLNWSHNSMKLNCS